MRDFIKIVLATVIGVILSGVIIVVLGIAGLVTIFASTSSGTAVSKNSVLVLNLSGVINEREEDNLLGQLTNNSVNNFGLDDIISAIKKAKVNDNIDGIYIEAGLLQTGFATLEEIRNALVDFKNSGKWIVSYGDNYSQGAYYIASVSDKVCLNPSGEIDWHGIGSVATYYKDLYAKIGIKYEVFKVGEYKSYTEQYTEEKMSDANREQMSVFINGIWRNICEDVSASRDISIDSLNSFADRINVFVAAETLKKEGMVDALIYADGMEDELKNLLKTDKYNINKLSINDMKSIESAQNSGDEIAIYYAYGSIVQTDASSLFSESHQIVADNVCEDLDDLLEDDDVKAVVIRINSGGGSAYASEQIWHSVYKLKTKKPVVVSMGDYAASGGYYMCCAADWIVAQPNTLTGSIGIFGLLPDLSDLATQKLGLKFDEVSTNRNSAFSYAGVRSYNNEEKESIQAYVDRGYNLFRQRVADGRGKNIEDIEKIAQGRVWYGEDALSNELVDELGGLDVAVAKAAELAGLDKFYTSDYPAPSSWIDDLLNIIDAGSYINTKLHSLLGDMYEPLVVLREAEENDILQARIPYILKVE